MCVDIDIFTFRLLQKHFQIAKIMTGYHNERPFFHFHADCCRNRCTISCCIGTVQKFHTDEIDFSYFQNLREKLFHGQVFSYIKQSFADAVYDFIIGKSENHGMVCVGSHTAQSEKNQRFQGADIFLSSPQTGHIIIIFSSAGISAICTGCGKFFLFFLNGIV